MYFGHVLVDFAHAKGLSSKYGITVCSCIRFYGQG